MNIELIKVDILETDGFINDDFALDTLYVTALISKASPVNWSEDSCTVFSNTVELVCLDKIVSDTKIDCNADEEYIIDLQITGGFPKLDSTSRYITMGNFNDTISINEIRNYKLDLSPYDRFNVYITDENACKDTLSNMHKTVFQCQ